MSESSHTVPKQRVDAASAGGDDRKGARRGAIFIGLVLIAYIIDQAPSVPIFHHELIYAWSNRLNCVVHDSTVHPYYIYEWSFAE